MRLRRMCEKVTNTLAYNKVKTKMYSSVSSNGLWPILYTFYGRNYAPSGVFLYDFD
jgi:hypothetical protein